MPTPPHGDTPNLPVLAPLDKPFTLIIASWVTQTALALPPGLPYADWCAVGEQLRYIQGSILWWLGDWAAYGEREYGDLKKAAEAMGYASQTVWNAKQVSESIETYRRREVLSWSHHAEVAALPVEEQETWLDRAVRGDGAGKPWSREELRSEVRSFRKAHALLALPAGVFDVIYADPPWPYSTQIESWGPTSLHYETLAIDDLKGLDVASLAADNATLFLWSTNPFLNQALDLAEAWGFTYKTNIVWVKTNLQRPGSGYYIRGRHELLFICTKGSHVPDQLGRAPIGSVLEADVQEHSRKPQEVYSLIERIYPGSRYLELFARAPTREGWTVWGSEANVSRD